MCGRPCKILSRFIEAMPRVKLHFSGSTPPEIFVGRVSYPNVFSGILSPEQKGETQVYSMPEEWVKGNLSIETILEYRGKMIYARDQGHVKSQSANSFKSVFENLALSSKPVSTEFFLKKSPKFEFSASKLFTIMANPAPIDKIILEENPKIEQKVDYVVSDYDVKATTALKELYSANILTSHLQKLMSAGLLGVKNQRKLVPTRWAITAVDDTLSKNLLEEIRTYKELNEILLFNAEYNGNHYEFLLLPENFSFEVIEAEMPGNLWNPSQKIEFMNDYEDFFGRTNYADNVTGAYYANRLGVCEYLTKIKKQASILVLREIREEYYAPLGVGILREITRKAFESTPEKPSTIDNALNLIQSRIKLPIEKFKEVSWMLKNYGKQKKLTKWF